MLVNARFLLPLAVATWPILLSPSWLNAQPVPLVNAHAHNDYEHQRPLFDALDHGFCSIEPDIWLVDGQLLVAHGRSEVKKERTLQALYLDPLRERVRQNQGRVYLHGPPCTLLIDVKSNAEQTYAALRDVLAHYAEMLTVFTPTNTSTKALTVILSGNRPTSMLAAEPLRYAAIDGRLADLEGNASPNLIPLISDNWTQHFRWRGQGAMPNDERQKLKQLVERAHQQGRRIRFWAAPNNSTIWSEMQQAGVDLLSTDDLAGVQKFLLGKSP